MKRHGKLLSLTLAVIMSAVMLVAASGLEIFIIASSDEYLGFSTSAGYLETIEVMQGYDDGDLHLEDPILRYQAALFFARVVSGITNDSAWGTGASANYSDVPEYGPVIDLITDMEIIRGYGNGYFGYNDGIRYQDMCAMLVRVLGYETEEMVATYPLSYILKVEELDLDLKDVKPTDYLNRGQTAQMVYDALVTEIKHIDDEKQAILERVIEKELGVDSINKLKDTYLERNFDVSPAMYFEICATENYKSTSALSFANEGYIDARLIAWSDEDNKWVKKDLWTIPVEGAATEEVSEAELIGKCIKLIFDEKEPTAKRLDREDCSIIFADMVKGMTYENFGELSYVKFDEEYEKLTLGTETISFIDDPNVNIWKYSDDAKAVCSPLTYLELAAAMEANTYFALDYYDYNKDGYCDTLIYRPYSFGQYAKRTYSGTAYTLVGSYRDSEVYDTTDRAPKNDATKTHFVEYFLGQELGTAAVASKSYNKYTPGDTSIKIDEVVGKYSATVTVSGKEIETGDFMIYYYNKLLNELIVVENLGEYQTGTLTGYKSSKQVYTLDGAQISVGLPGYMTDNNGLLVGDGAFAEIYDEAKVIVSNYEKGKENVKYLEYDGKIIYLDSYGGTDAIVGSEWVIIDAEETLEKYKDSLDDEDDAWDVPFDGRVALLQKLNPATGEFEEIRVEELIVKSGNDEVVHNFKNVDERHELGTWEDNTLYQLIIDNGSIYAIEDEDNNGNYELYGYDTHEFNVLGAKVLPARGNNPSVFFSYNRSNLFVDENSVGVLTDRITTGENTISIIIGQDGYRMVKGALGTNSTANPNALWLSDAAIIIEATDSQLTIYDPTMYVMQYDTGVVETAEQVYHNKVESVWNTGSVNEIDGIGYYILLENSVYGESYAVEEEDGSIKENDNGDRLYAHEYKNIYNLVTGATESITMITTSLDAPATEVINSVNGVIRYDAEKNEATLTNFGEVFVDNGDYRYGGFGWLAAKDKISFVTQPKDENGNGTISGTEEAQSFFANAESDPIYNTLKSLNVTFIDLDGGADLDSDEYCFTDAYLFYQDSESNRKSYASVQLEDREAGVDYPIGTFPVRRHTVSAKDVSGNIGNGRVTTLTAGKEGLIGSAGFYRWNGWCDYLVPAVNDDGDTIWAYEGSVRVRVNYYAYIDFDEKAKTVDAVVVRVGEVDGVVGRNDDVPEIENEPTDPGYTNVTEE